MSKKEITLYYADWCGHCQKFKPQWEILKKSLDKYGVSYNEYEDSKDSSMISKNNIQGFPTIRIKQNGKEYEYIGPRQATEILHELNVLPNINNKKDVKKFVEQSGGVDDFYKYKLEKYRTKYNELRKWAQENGYKI